MSVSFPYTTMAAHYRSSEICIMGFAFHIDIIWLRVKWIDINCVPIETGIKRPQPCCFSILERTREGDCRTSLLGPAISIRTVATLASLRLFHIWMFFPGKRRFVLQTLIKLRESSGGWQPFCIYELVQVLACRLLDANPLPEPLTLSGSFLKAVTRHVVYWIYPLPTVIHQTGMTSFGSHQYLYFYSIASISASTIPVGIAIARQREERPDDVTGSPLSSTRDTNHTNGKTPTGGFN